MWVEHSAQIHTWVHPSGPTPHRHHQELGRGWVARRVWTQSRTLQLGKGCRWWGARIDAVASASADRSRFREAPRIASPSHKGEDPHTVEVPAALVDCLADHPSPLQAPSGRPGVLSLWFPDPGSVPAESYLGVRRQSPRAGGRPGSLPRRAPRPACLAWAPDRRAQTSGAAAPGSSRSPALRPPPSAAPGPRSLARPCGSPGAVQSEPETLARLLEGWGHGRLAAPEGPLPLRRGWALSRPRLPTEGCLGYSKALQVPA